MDKYSGNVGWLVGFNWEHIHIYILTQENPLLMEGFVGTSNYFGNHLANYHWWVYKPTYSGGASPWIYFPQMVVFCCIPSCLDKPGFTQVSSFCDPWLEVLYFFWVKEHNGHGALATL
jgi:hypothetical protein